MFCSIMCDVHNAWRKVPQIVAAFNIQFGYSECVMNGFK